jgi:hypothetical protein
MNIIIKKINHVINTVKKINDDTEFKSKKICKNITNDLENFVLDIKNNNKQYIFSQIENCCVDSLTINTTIFKEGHNRYVFLCNNNDMVIKKDKYSFVKACLNEYIFWLIIKNTKYNDLFVPIVAIDKNFTQLICEKAQDNFIWNQNEYDKIFNTCKLFGFYIRPCNVLFHGCKLKVIDYDQQIDFNENFFNIITQEIN